MTNHTLFTVATDIEVYFCDPQSPWQRGSNENMNRLLRAYFPKGTDLSVHDQQKLNSITRQLNERPRKLQAMSHPQSDLTSVLHPSIVLTAKSGHC